MTGDDNAKALRDLADNVRALTVEVRTTVEYDRAPGLGADGIRRRGQERGRHRIAHRGLLLQLAAALLPGRRSEDSGGGRSAPGPRLPCAPDATAALDAIWHGWRPEPGAALIPGAWELRERLRAATGRRTRTRRRPGLAGVILEIRALAHLAPPDQLEQAAAAAHAWATLARTVLGYEAPVVTLRDVRCPGCAQRLKVRQDASSDVWCPTPDCLDDDGRRRSWSRAEWPFLLERLGRRKDAAA